MKPRKLLERLRHGSCANVSFADFTALVEAFGFRLGRSTGSHRIYFHDKATRPLNLQPMHGDAKPYQIRQFLQMVTEFDLTMENREL